MATFTYVHGDTLKVDHTEVGAVAGNSLVINTAFGVDTLLAAHTPKDAGVVDGYSYPNGTAVYEAVGFTLAAGDAAGVDLFDKIYYDVSADELSTTATSDPLLGTVISAGEGQTDNLWIVFGG